VPSTRMGIPLRFRPAGDGYVGEIATASTAAGI
jgi:hypothetical protein